jgi:hypothetical protein
MSAPCLQSTIHTILHHVVVLIPHTRTASVVCAQSAGAEQPRKLHNTAAECRQPPCTALLAAMRAPAAAYATLARRCGHSTASATRPSVPLVTTLRRGSMAAMLPHSPVWCTIMLHTEAIDGETLALWSAHLQRQQRRHGLTKVNVCARCAHPHRRLQLRLCQREALLGRLCRDVCNQYLVANAHNCCQCSRLSAQDQTYGSAAKAAWQMWAVCGAEMQW